MTKINIEYSKLNETHSKSKKSLAIKLGYKRGINMELLSTIKFTIHNILFITYKKGTKYFFHMAFLYYIKDIFLINYLAIPAIPYKIKIHIQVVKKSPKASLTATKYFFTLQHYTFIKFYTSPTYFMHHGSRGNSGNHCHINFKTY